MFNDLLNKLEDKVQNAAETIEQLRGEIAGLKEENSTLKAEKDEWEAKLTALIEKFENIEGESSSEESFGEENVEEPSDSMEASSEEYHEEHHAEHHEEHHDHEHYPEANGEGEFEARQFA